MGGRARLKSRSREGEMTVEDRRTRTTTGSAARDVRLGPGRDARRGADQAHTETGVSERPAGLRRRMEGTAPAGVERDDLVRHPLAIRGARSHHP